MVKIKSPLQITEIAKVNLRHNSIPHIFIAVILLLLTPVLFGTRNLNATAAAIPLEMFVCLIGIVLLTPIFKPEENPEIDDLISSKYISPITVYCIRACYSLIVTFVLIGAFSAYMYACNCTVTLSLVTGTTANAVFLGSIGMLSASLFSNTAIGYMLPLTYYASNFGLGSKLGYFYLFSMTTANFSPKVWLFAIGILLIIASIVFKKLCKKRL